MKHHILLVDDDLYSREMTTKLLKADGYRVSHAINGEDALENVVRDPPDVVLMDLSLPVLDGWEATRRLKTRPESEQIPVIALTAHAMRGDRERALEAGCDDYLAKPFDYSELRAKLESLLNLK